MLRFVKVAMPLTAATVVVPASAPPPGLVRIVSVTLPLNPVAVFPWASWAVTCTAGVIAAPAVTLAGGTENTARAAHAGQISKAVPDAPAWPAPDPDGVKPRPPLFLSR